MAMPTQQSFEFGFPVRPMIALPDAMRLIEEIGMFHRPLGQNYWYELIDDGTLEATRVRRNYFVYTDSLIKWVLSFQPEDVRQEWGPRIEAIVYGKSRPTQPRLTMRVVGPTAKAEATLFRVAG
jgi:hypothetical protein